MQDGTCTVPCPLSEAAGMFSPFVPALWVWSVHTSITGIRGTEKLVLPEKNNNAIYCIVLLRVSKTVRKAGMD